MKTTPKPATTWYDTPFGRLCRGQIRRRPERSVAQVLAELNRRHS